MAVFKRVPLIFVILCCVAFYYADMSFPFVLNQVITRFIRDGVMVLALIIPIRAGMGEIGRAACRERV